MNPRFPFMSNLTYDQHVIANRVFMQTATLPDGPDKAVIQSVLHGSRLGAQATIRAGQDTVNAISQSGTATVDAINASASSLSHQMHNVALANIFGSLLTSGTIAIATKLILKKADKLHDSVERLGVQFSEGLSLVVTQLDIQNRALSSIQEQLSKIHQTLKTPTATQAAEWRETGLLRMSNELYPESIKAFEQSLAFDETDPIANFMLGKIYLDAVSKDGNFHDPAKAKHFFRISNRYASAFQKNAPDLAVIKIDSLYLCAVAILAEANKHMVASHSKHLDEQALQSALDILDQITLLAPDHLQGRYLRAKILVFLGKTKEAETVICPRMWCQ